MARWAHFRGWINPSCAGGAFRSIVGSEGEQDANQTKQKPKNKACSCCVFPSANDRTKHAEHNRLYQNGGGKVV